MEMTMQSTILILTIVFALALFAWLEWNSPSRNPTIRILLLGIATLALVGLLTYWGLPVATSILNG